MSTTAQLISSEKDRSDQSTLCLGIVADCDGIAGAEIANLTGLPIGSISRALGGLRANGDVFRDDEKNGAKYYAAKTDHDRQRLRYLYGHEERGRALNKMRNAANKLFTVIDPADRATLRGIFERINKNV